MKLLGSLAAMVLVTAAAGNDAGRLPVTPGMYDAIPVPQPYLWPPPREVSFPPAVVPLVRDSQRLSLIVIGDQAGPKARLGAETLSALVADRNLLAVNLPVRPYGKSGWSDLRDANPIIIGTLQDNALVERLVRRHGLPLTARRPGPEGYIIRVVPWGDRGERQAVMVGGSDDQGTLYGCQALAQLLRGEGCSTWLRAATVTDWPGFRWRPTGWGYEVYHERSKTDVREYADLIGRLRFNVATGGGSADPEITAFAEARGLAMLDGYWSMEGFARYAQENIPRRCVPKGTSANCWSDPGLRQRIREVFGDVARTASGVSWHDNTDAGWWTPYLQFWNQRCELCRETYPEPDPRRGDAERFQAIYEAAKAHGADKLVVLTLPCYYDNPERFPLMVEYLHYLRDHLPRDIVFWLEDRSPAEAESYERHLGRPCINYLYANTGGGRTWAEDFARVAANKGHVSGCWYAIGHRPEELLTMMASAYQWNPDLPTDLAFIYRVLVPQACHFLYGDAWRHMAEVYLQNMDPAQATSSKDPVVLRDIVTRSRRSLALLAEALPQLTGQGRVTAEALRVRDSGLLQTAETRLAYVEPLQKLRDALALVRDGDHDAALGRLSEAAASVEAVPARLRTDELSVKRLRYLALDLERLQDRIRRQDLQLVAREPVWQIGVFDNLLDEFAGETAGKRAEFAVGTPLAQFPAEGGYTLVFDHGLPAGGRLLVRIEGTPVTISLDGAELYYTYDLTPGFNDVTVPLPALDPGEHRLTVTPDGRLRTDAVALYPGQELVPTSAANEWLLDTSGTWDFRLDPGDVGEREGWYRQPVDPRDWTTISVPAYWESDPRFPSYDGVAWYHTSVKLPWEHHTKPVVLRFGGVDDYTKVWVAGNYIGKHDQEDSEFHWFDEAFEFDVSGKIPFGDGADIYVRVEDTHGDGGIFRPVTVAVIIGGKDTAPIVGPGALGY
ncbi:MAG: hypothetical protein HPY69_03435 [Armatimonadetes bacterium]|nr:hypothetical protein [Armatimonadota bacterium]